MKLFKKNVHVFHILPHAYTIYVYIVHGEIKMESILVDTCQ